MVIGVIAIAALAISFFFDEMGIRKYLAMQQHVRDLAHDIQEIERTNTDLHIEIKRIQHDPVRMEELARASSATQAALERHLEERRRRSS